MTKNDVKREKKLGVTDRWTDRRTEWVIESPARDEKDRKSTSCFQVLKVMLSLARTPMIETAMVLKIH